MDDLEVVERGIALYWKTLASVRGLAYATEREYDYVISENRSGPERILNVRIQDDPEDRLWELAARIKAGELPDSILMTDRARPDLLSHHFRAMGFEIDTSGLCMATDLARTSLDCTPEAGLQLLELTDESRLPQWAHIVNTALFGCELFRPEQYSDLFRLGNTRFYMAKCGGVPVCACMTIFEDDVATLEMVATLAEYRRRGIATALIRKALRDLRGQGVRTATLRAEVDGIGVYRKIGFRVVCPRTVASYNWNLAVREP